MVCGKRLLFFAAKANMTIFFTKFSKFFGSKLAARVYFSCAACATVFCALAGIGFDPCFISSDRLVPVSPITYLFYLVVLFSVLIRPYSKIRADKFKVSLSVFFRSFFAALTRFFYVIIIILPATVSYFFWFVFLNIFCILFFTRNAIATQPIFSEFVFIELGRVFYFPAFWTYFFGYNTHISTSMLVTYPGAQTPRVYFLDYIIGE